MPIKISAVAAQAARPSLALAVAVTRVYHEGVENPRSIELRGRTVALTVRRSARARRLGLRIAGHDDSVELVLPSGAREADGLAFLRERADWVLTRLRRLPARVEFADGAALPLGGVQHIVRRSPGRRRPVVIEGREILVSGAPEHLPRRLTDWLRAEAKRRIEPLAQAHAGEIGKTVTRITVRDQKSRWGSCAPGGRLSFSWRLVLAPETVLDYVVAHEVAHLAEANHSPAFWRIVDRLTGDRAKARGWLRRNGTTLHRYG